MIHFYFSVVLENHHKVLRTPDHTNRMVAGALATLLLIGTVTYFRRRTPAMWRNGLMVLVSAMMLGFTLHRERPNVHLSPERKGITQLSKLYKDSYLRQYPLYANHTWFFWPDDLGYPGPNYHTLTKAAIQAAAPHSVFLWENHYSHRLSGDGAERWIMGHTGLVALAPEGRGARSALTAQEKAPPHPGWTRRGLRRKGMREAGNQCARRAAEERRRVPKPGSPILEKLPGVARPGRLAFAG